MIYDMQYWSVLSNQAYFLIVVISHGIEFDGFLFNLALDKGVLFPPRWSLCNFNLARLSGADAGDHRLKNKFGKSWWVDLFCLGGLLQKQASVS